MGIFMSRMNINEYLSYSNTLHNYKGIIVGERERGNNRDMNKEEEKLKGCRGI